ncbi:MAG: glycosyltransferase [Verrucomicrobiota bacterium]
MIIWGFWLLLVLIAALRVFGFLIARRVQDKRWGDGSKDQKSVVIIVPVKGFDLQATPRFFDTLFTQKYLNYRVIVTFESWNEPVANWLREELEVDSNSDSATWSHPDEKAALRSITLVSAGLSKQEGQKVWNQRAAFSHLSAEDGVIAFVDADISFKKTWLALLTAPINQKTHPLSTTYRWLVPKRPTLPNQVASVINASIATQGGSELTNVLWGGSMAIDRKVFDSLDVETLFTGSLNDDLRLSKAARKAGNRVAFIRSLILPTSIDFTWREFFEFARRQYTQVKFFSPILYRCVNVVLGFYALGLLSIIGALIYGYFFAWIPIAASYVIDQFRSLARQQVYLSLYEENGIRRKLFSASWLEHMITPAWMLLHWLLLVSTWTQNRITWAGISYGILGPDKTRILDRPVVAERLPVGVPGLALIAELRDRRRTGYTQPITTSIPLSSSTESKPGKTGKAPLQGETSSTALKEVLASSSSPEPAGAATDSEAKQEAEGLTSEPAPAMAHPGPNERVTLISAGALAIGLRPRSHRESQRPRSNRFPRHFGVSAKTRLQPSPRFPVTPRSTLSASPSSSPPPVSNEPVSASFTSADPPSTTTIDTVVCLPLAGRASLVRPFRQRRSREVGPVARRTASSNRPVQAARRSSAPRKRQPVAGGPSARPPH